MAIETRNQAPHKNDSSPTPIGQVIAGSLSHVSHTPELFNKVEYIPSNARKAIALKLQKTYRIYILLQHLNRYRHRGHGKFVLTESDLEFLSEHLHRSPITIERLIERMIKDDIFVHGKFCRFPYISLVSQVKLSQRLALLAKARGIPELAEVSYRKEVLELSDFASLQSVSSQMLNGWLRVSKRNTRRLRWEDLSALWNKSRPTLTKWLKLRLGEQYHLN